MYETLKFTEMTTRRVIDAKDKDGEKVYVKGHAKATYMSDGRTVEDAIKQIGTGGGGGGGIAVETDPIFSASPAATITDEKIAEWDNKYSKPSGGITQSDLAEEVKGALRKAEQYTGTVTEIKLNGNNIGANNGVVDLGNLGTYSKPSTGIPKSDLNPSVQTSLEKADTAVQPADIKDEVYIADFTMESLRVGVYNGTDVDCNVQALVDAMNANKVILVRQDEDSDYKGVYVLNGFAEDLLYFSIVDTSGNILWCEGTDYWALQYIDGSTLHLQSWDEKQDTLVSGENIKTINGESIVGSGNITISGGSGEVGPQGPQGDKGDKGDTGVGVQSVTQTTTSNADGGSNVVTVTLTNGTKSTFTVKNGSKGSNGTNGTNGKDGADGATFTPSVDSAGNLSWTNNKGLTNPPTVNIKGPKGDKGDAGEGGGGSSGGGGVETILLSGGLGRPLIIDEMLAEKRYCLYVDSGLDGSEQSIVIVGFEGDGVADGVHIRHFYAVIECVSAMGDPFDVSLSLPDVDIRWSTGTPIPIRGDGRYELSITQVIDSGFAYYNAVLTSFSL